MVLDTAWVRAVDAARGGQLIKLDPGGTIQYVSRSALRLVGSHASPGRRLLDIVAHGDRESVQTMLEDALNLTRAAHAEFRVIRPDGPAVFLEGAAAVGQHDGGQCIIVRLRDISERKAEEEEVRRQVRWFQAVTRSSGDVIAVFDDTWRCVFVSGSVLDVLGYTPDEMSWDAFGGAIQPDDRQRVADAVRRATGVPGSAERVEYRLRRKDGRLIFAESTLVNSFEDEDVRGFLVYIRDITERAVTDPATQLPNGTFLLEHLRQLMGRPPLSIPRYSLLLVRVDRYDTLEAGLSAASRDALLMAVAERLRSSVANHGMVARVESDLFGVLIEDMQDAAFDQSMAERIEISIFPPFEVDDRDLHLTVSIGIAQGDKERAAAADLLKDARTALQAASQPGRARKVLYNSAMARTFMARFGLEHELRGAADRGELALHFQPVVVTRSHRIAGFEVLARWNSPTRGHVPPSLFIPIAEEIGVIEALGDWVIAGACEQLARWATAEPQTADLFLSVNLSTHQLVEDRLVACLERNTSRFGVPPERLKLEVTETAIVTNPDVAARTLSALRDRGFGLSLDDFGTGYSSLGYLHRFPFDTIKVDRSFVAGLDQADQRNLALVRTILRLSEELGLASVAEGVETESQVRRLSELEATFLQGYYFGRPVTAEAALALFQVAEGGGLPPGMPGASPA